MSRSESSNLEFLDVLAIISFALQIQNQSNIIGIRDVQREVNRAVSEIHAHLETQDDKIDKLVEVLLNEDDKMVI